jgi:hypothetical protein
VGVRQLAQRAVDLPTPCRLSTAISRPAQAELFACNEFHMYWRAETHAGDLSEPVKGGHFVFLVVCQPWIPSPEVAPRALVCRDGLLL